MSTTRTTTTTSGPGRVAEPADRLIADPPVSRLAGSARLAVPIGVAVATVVNLAVYGLARAAGVDLVLVDGGEPHRVMTLDVVTASILPLGLGLVVATVVALRWAGVLRLAQVVGGGAGILTAAGPLVADADWGTRLALAAMHVVVGVAAIVVLEVVRRHRSTTGG